MLKAVKGHVNGYIPIKNGGGVYSLGFYKLLSRYVKLQDVVCCKTFVNDQEENLERMHSILHAKYAKHTHDDVFDVTKCVEFIDLVKQTYLDCYFYINVLTEEERLLLCMNVLVDFENGVHIQDDEESIELYRAWLCSEQTNLPPCTMPFV